MIRSRSLARFCALLLLGAAAGCGGKGSPVEPPPPGREIRLPEELADMDGTIIAASGPARGPTRMLRVEQPPIIEGPYHMADVTVRTGVMLLRRGRDGKLGTATMSDLGVGVRVQVWFSQVFPGTTPVQAEASTVLILP